MDRSEDLARRFAEFCTSNSAASHAQLRQDLLVIFLLQDKRSGFFVEFGAGNGRDLSNTYLLEHDYGWTGLLAEPAKSWHAALKANRAASIDTRCVWRQTGEHLAFKEMKRAEFSTLDAFAKSDRAQGMIYSVETVSLDDLLKAHRAPREIDYLSIDTEGSELEILRAFNFTDFDIKVVTVEHNFVTPNRQGLFRLLSAQGFVRLFERRSRFDDWYVKRSVLLQLGGSCQRHAPSSHTYQPSMKR